MPDNEPANTNSLLRLWQRLAPLPGGVWLFNRLLAWRVPYTGSIRARVDELGAGHCRVTLREHRAVRNHLHSIHAVALVNLGEMTSGLAMLCGLPENARGIVVNIATEYFKKARGTLKAECQCEVPLVTQDMEYQLVTNIYDQQHELVARTTTCWRLGLINL